MHVLQHLREALRIAEVAVIEAGDVGVLLDLGEVERAGLARAAARRRQRRAGRGQRADESSPRWFWTWHVSSLPSDYLLTGLSGLISSATASLICSMVSTLLVPKRGMFEHGKRGVRVVDLLVGRLGVGLAEVAQLAVFEQARAERAVAHFLPGQLVAGVAVAAIGAAAADSR